MSFLCHYELYFYSQNINALDHMVDKSSFASQNRDLNWKSKPKHSTLPELPRQEPVNQQQLMQNTHLVQSLSQTTYPWTSSTCLSAKGKWARLEAGRIFLVPAYRSQKLWHSLSQQGKGMRDRPVSNQQKENRKTENLFEYCCFP